MKHMGLRVRDPQDLVQQVFDNDPQIQYSNGWILGGFLNKNKNPPKSETSHSTAVIGSTIFISFHGTQVNASGTIPAGDAPLMANYVLDGVQTLPGSIPAASQDTIHQTLFRSPVLEDGFHNLTVQVTQTGQGRNYTFQQFNVSSTPASDASSGPSVGIPDVDGGPPPGPQNGSSPPGPQNGSSPPDPQSGSSSPDPQSGSSSPDPQSGSSSPDPQSGSSSPDPQDASTGETRKAASAVIVGGVLGAIIFVLLLVLLLLCFWKRKRASATRRHVEQSQPAPVYFARPISDGSEKEGDVYWQDSPSVIDTNSKFTFVVRKDAGSRSSQSLVSVDRPPTIPRSALISPRRLSDWSTYKGSSEINEGTRTFRSNDRDFSEWSSYKGSSVILPQRQPDRSHFSPYTSTTLTPMAFEEPTLRGTPRNKQSLSRNDSRSSLSPLPPPFERGMF